MSSYTPISRAIIDTRVISQVIVYADGTQEERYQQQILRDDDKGWQPITVIHERLINAGFANVAVDPSEWIEEAK